jgi:hypothetical protein
MWLAFSASLSAFASTAVALWLSGRSVPLAVPLVASVCGAFALTALLVVLVDAGTAAYALPGPNGTTAASPARALVNFWRSLYWAALLFGWLATETLCELVVAGDFTSLGRLRSAVRASLRLYALVAALCAVGALYLLFWLHVSLSELPNIAALLVNGHGLLLLSLLHGQGLVELPRALWTLAPPRAALAQRYYTLALCDEDRVATASKLRHLLQKVGAADAAAPPPASRGQSEKACWDALLRSTRAAAADCRLEELDGGGLAWGLRSAWAHTIGTPRGAPRA